MASGRLTCPSAQTENNIHGHRCQRPRLAIVWQKRTGGNVDGVAKSNETERQWENGQQRRQQKQETSLLFAIASCILYAILFVISLLSSPFVQNGN